MAQTDLTAVLEEVWKGAVPEEIAVMPDANTGGYTIVIHDRPEPTHWTYMQLKPPSTTWQASRPALLGSTRDAATWMDTQVQEALTRHRWPYNRLTPVAALMAPAGDMAAYLGGI